MLIYSSAEAQTKYGRVVKLVDSLDSGSSVHCGRAGSSPASPTKKSIEIERFRCFFFFYDKRADSNQSNAARTSAACDGSTAQILD